MTKDRADIEFTDVEVNVLRMIVGNMSEVEIAFALDIEQSSVEKINQQIFSKLGATDRAVAAEMALKLGLVKLEL